MRQGFQTRFCETETSDFRLFALLKPIDYLSLDGVHYQCCAGSQTDLASIPKAVWSILPPAGSVNAEYALPALLHDCSYRNTLNVVDQWDISTKANLTKGQRDLLLKEAMESCGVSSLVVEIIYKAVCDFGMSSFISDGNQ